MKRLLFIAYSFPPCGGAGVQRSAKFVRYLPDYGWTPTVLTVSPSCYGVQDASHATELPQGVELIRTKHTDPVVRFGRAAQSPNGNGSEPHPRTYGEAGVKALRSVAKTAWVAVDRNLLIPDQATMWCPRAVSAGLLAHRRRPFDLIYATGEPYSAYFSAMTLSRLTGIPYVIDMRDPWTLAPYRQERLSLLRQSVEQWQERQVLSGCRAAVFANRASDLYANAFPQWVGKFHYIPNGYDPADFEGVEPKRFEKFTIVHSGTFLPGYRTAHTFLHALRGLLDREPALAERLQVFFVGKLGEERHLVHSLLLSGVVHQTGYVPHRESIAYLKGADLLLLVGGKHQWEETGKVYEYMASGKPILALAHPEGGVADVLHVHPCARIVDRLSVDRTREALQDLLGERAGVDAAGSEHAARFERKRLTGELAGVFDAALE